MKIEKTKEFIKEYEMLLFLKYDKIGKEKNGSCKKNCKRSSC